MSKQYLGDAVYVDQNDWGALVLTTENGIETTNAIVLEPETYAALVRYVERLKEGAGTLHDEDMGSRRTETPMLVELVRRLVRTVSMNPDDEMAKYILGSDSWQRLKEAVGIKQGASDE